MGLLKDKVYKDELVEPSPSSKNDKMVEVDPKVRIPFDAESIKGLGIDDEVEIVLTGKVCSMKAGKERWDNGLEVELSDGSVKAISKSEEEKQVDSFMETE